MPAIRSAALNEDSSTPNSSKDIGVCGELVGEMPLSQVVENAGLFGTFGTLSNGQALTEMAKVIEGLSSLQD